MWAFLPRAALVLASTMCVLSRAAPAQTPPTVSRPSLARVDFKVVFWFRRDRPLDTFKYQVYDVRKGEYTSAVDAWFDLMRAKHPDYVAFTRDVDLAQEKGKTEERKLGSVIMRELTAAAGLAGVLVGGPPVGLSSPSPHWRSRPSAPSARTALPYSSGPEPSRSVDLGPPPYTFPVPMPYPRPHP